MLKLTITIQGHAQDDLEIALDAIRKQVSQGFTCGFSENDTGFYRFNVDGEPEQYEFRVLLDWEGETNMLFNCMAENEGHAMEQAVNAYPGAEITKVEKLT